MASFMDDPFGVLVKLSAECRGITVIWVSWSIIDNLLLHTSPNADGQGSLDYSNSHLHLLVLGRVGKIEIEKIECKLTDECWILNVDQQFVLEHLLLEREVWSGKILFCLVLTEKIVTVSP
jgi:hypothetical protein